MKKLTGFAAVSVSPFLASRLALAMLSLLLLLLCAPPDSAAADEAAAERAAAERLLDAARVEESIVTMQNKQKEHLEVMMRNFVSKNLPAGRPEEIRQFQSQIFDRIYQEMRWEKLKPDFVQAYCEVFTEDEMNQLHAFYQSPIGKTLLEKTPQLTVKSMEVTQKHMSAILPEIQRMAAEFDAKTRATAAEADPASAAQAPAAGAGTGTGVAMPGPAVPGSRATTTPTPRPAAKMPAATPPTVPSPAQMPGEPDTLMPAAPAGPESQEAP